MLPIGITSYAAYVPRLRIERAVIAAAHEWALPALKSLAKGERSFCSWDEDAITMGVEAARACLAGHRPSIGALTLASTTHVFADLQNATLVAAACGLPERLATSDVSGSLRAATSALRCALESPAEEGALLVAADHRHARPGSPQEMQYGAGACAVSTGSGDVLARYLGGVSVTLPFVDHFRAADQPYDYTWEERWVREEGYLKIVPEAIGRLLAASNANAGDIAFFCLPSPLPDVARAVARELKFGPQSVVDNLHLQSGDAGTAQPLLMLSLALESARPGQKILLVGFGSGCDALLFEATDVIAAYRSPAPVSAALAKRAPQMSYNKLISFNGELQIDWGMRSETDTKTALTQLYRARDQVLAFVGGRCGACGAVQFPRMPACVRCGATAPQGPVPLADEPAKVATWTADWLMYYPAPPLYVGHVQFANGARVLMEMVDVDPKSLDVGTDVRMVFRIKESDVQRHFNRYFWKAAPL
jgi:3-hydroxy-3-methylglutaryl CoA synthase